MSDTRDLTYSGMAGFSSVPMSDGTTAIDTTDCTYSGLGLVFLLITLAVGTPYYYNYLNRLWGETQ